MSTKNCLRGHLNPPLQKICLQCGYIFPGEEQLGDYQLAGSRQLLDKNLYLAYKDQVPCLLVETMEFFLPPYRESIYGQLGPLLQELGMPLLDWFTLERDGLVLLYTAYPGHLWQALDCPVQGEMRQSGLLPPQQWQTVYGFMRRLMLALTEAGLANPGMILPQIFRSQDGTALYLLEWEYTVPLDDTLLFPRYYIGYHNALSLMPQEARGKNRKLALSAFYSSLLELFGGKSPQFFYPEAISLKAYQVFLPPALLKTLESFQQTWDVAALPDALPLGQDRSAQLRNSLELANHYFNQGYQALQDQQLDEAAELLQQASSHNLNDPHIHRYQAQIALRQQQFPVFAAHMRQAIHIQPLACLFYESAVAKAGRNLLEEALTDLQQATGQCPFYAEAYHLLGQTYEWLGQVKEAEKAYQSARFWQDNPLHNRSLHRFYVDQHLEQEGEPYRLKGLSTAGAYVKKTFKLERPALPGSSAAEAEIACPRGHANAEAATVCTACSAPLYRQPGETIGSYRIISLIRLKDYQQDRFDTVYLAQEAQTGQHFVLKETFLSRRPRQIYEQEIAIMEPLHHPALIPLAHHFRAGLWGYLVYPHCEGQTLQEKLLEEGCVDEALARRLFRAIGSAIVYFQARPQPIIHCDIKPANILLAADGSIRLLDFESARILTQERIYPSYTYPYSPPELDLEHKINLTTASYALGVTLIHALTGIFPQLFLSYSHHQFQKWERYAFHISQAMKQLLNALTHWKADRRLQLDAGALARQWQELDQLPARPVPAQVTELARLFMDIATFNDPQEIKPLIKELLAREQSGVTLYFAATHSARVGQEEDALDFARHALVADETFAQAYWFLGQIYVKRKWYREAIALLIKSLKYCQTAYEPYWLLGICYANTDQLKLALAAYQRAKQHYPVSLGTDFDLASLHLATRNYPEVQQLCLQLLDNYPPPAHKAKLHHLLGYSYAQQGYTRNAIAEFEKALACVPDQSDILVDLGIACYRMKEFDRSLACMQQCLALTPDHRTAQFYQAVLAIETKDGDTALACLQQIERYGENLGEIYFQMGRAHTLLSQLREALIAYNKALEENPAAPQTYVNIGNLYILMEQPEQARQAFERAAALAPELNIEAYCRSLLPGASP